MYGCKNLNAYSNIARDIEEKAIFEEAVKNKTKLILGVCRGSQFLCVMNGGMLIQDCGNHAMFGTHEIVYGDKIYEITSTHHQMQYPFNLSKDKYNILAYPPRRRSRHYTIDEIKQDIGKIEVEPEIVVYNTSKKTKSLAIQGHPEMMRESPVHEMLNDLIDKILNENA